MTGTIDLAALAEELRGAGYSAEITMEDYDRPEWETIELVVNLTSPSLEVYRNGFVNLQADKLEANDWPAIRIIDRHLTAAGLAPAPRPAEGAGE